MASVDGLAARARNQRVEPSGAMSPICVPASASRLAFVSGTSTRYTAVIPPRYQLAR